MSATARSARRINNLMLWVNACGVMEAGRLAEKTGIDLVKLREALMMSSGASDSLKEWDLCPSPGR